MESTRFASALSTDSDAKRAENEVLTNLEAALEGRKPDFLVAFVSHHYGTALEGLGKRLQARSGASLLIGCTGESIVGGQREIERGPALSVWAASAPAMQVRPFGVRPHHTPEGELGFDHLPPVEAADQASILLLADPYTFPMTQYLEQINQQFPGVPAVGGMASGGRGPGQNFLFMDDELLPGGALGVVIEGGIEVRSVVSQGCRPVGKPWVITNCKDNLVLKLGGRPAVQALAETLKQVSEQDRALLQRGPFIGLAVDANKPTFERGDFLVRGITGLQPPKGAIAVSDESMRNGQTIQFLVRDAESAGEDLQQLVRDTIGTVDPLERDRTGALLFSCNGRGSRMFPTADHDIRCVQSALDTEIPAAGFFANGEIGPIGGRNFLHGQTASLAIFRARD